MRFVGLSTDNEVLSMHTEIGKMIEQTVQEYSEAILAVLGKNKV